MTVKIVTYQPLEPGPRLTVLGAVHGNETCGAKAIERMVADIDDRTVILRRGTLQLVPVTNPGAYAKNVRFVERNLNRYLYRKEEKQHYEDHLDPIVCGVLDTTDVLLDLHSYTSPGGPFIFLGGDNAKELAFAKALGVSDFAFGWAQAFGKASEGKEAQGTTEYARTKGALAVTLECGQHLNADAPDIGYRAILLALAHLDMLDDGCAAALGLDRKTVAGKQRFVRMKNVYHREEGAVFARPWRHFDPVAKGEPMASLASGKTLSAPEDGFIVLPKESSATGEEWFFFGTGMASPDTKT